MKKLLFTLFTLLVATLVSAQEAEVTLATSKEYGSSITFYPVQKKAGDKVVVDWGDGVKQEYNVNPQGWGSERKVSGAVKGDTIRVFCELTSLDIEDNALTYLALKKQPSLTTLKATKNQLTREKLFLGESTAITYLDLSHNKLLNLNLFNQTALENVYVNNNPELNTVVFPDELLTLKQVNLSQCDIVHFYPKKLTNLQSLDITNGSLAELELGNNYPNLTTLKVGGNMALSTLDVSKQTKLYDLDVSKTALTQLNTFNNKELTSLNVRSTGLKTLDLKNNKDLTTLDCGNTKITKLDVTMLPKISRLALDSTDVARLDLFKASYLRDLNIRNTKIGFLDLHACNVANLLNRLDLRDCPNFTPQTLNFLFYSMPALARKVWTTNVFLKGSNAETSKTSLITEDVDIPYKPDVTGDGSASMDSVTINKETVEGGSYTLTQIPSSFSDDNWTPLTTKAKPGYPISLTPTPASGYYYVGVMINDKEVNDTLFTVSQNATIKPIFRKGASEKVITLTVQPNAEQNYFLSAEEENTPVTVDWGNGVEETYSLKSTLTNIQGRTKGTKVVIKGLVTGAVFDSYEFFGTENNISAIDVTKNDILKSLSFYMNPVTSLDLSSNTELTELNCSYTQLENLDLTHNTKLHTLLAYHNNLTSLDVSKAVNLEILNVKLNKLKNLDLSHNTLLKSLNVMSNQLSALDVHHLANLVELEAQDNKLTNISLDANAELLALSLSGNPLANINLQANKKLLSLNLDGCNMAVPDLRQNTNLQAINVSHNNWDACTLNDFYALLPEFTLLPGYKQIGNYTLWNEGNTHFGTQANAVEHSETNIATGKGWIVNAEGDGKGCEDVYVFVKPTTNGSVKLFVNNEEKPVNSKVKRGSQVTVKAVSDTGYKVTSMHLNGRSLPHGVFNAAKSSTLVVAFSVDTAIDGVENSTATAIAGVGKINFTTEKATPVSVYSLQGETLYTSVVNGTEILSLAKGIYLVKLNDVVRKMMVK